MGNSRRRFLAVLTATLILPKVAWAHDPAGFATMMLAWAIVVHLVTCLALACLITYAMRRKAHSARTVFIWSLLVPLVMAPVLGTGLVAIGLLPALESDLSFIISYFVIATALAVFGASRGWNRATR